MSLLRATRIEDRETYSPDMIKGHFINHVTTYSVEPSRTALVGAIGEYSLYAYCYIKEMARTFDGNSKMKESMTAMNSILAEMCSEQEVPYYDPKEGYTIIDKALEYVMEYGETGLDEAIDNTIDTMVDNLKEDLEEV